METTTAEYFLDTTTNLSLMSADISSSLTATAADILSGSASSYSIAGNMEQHHNQITFEIPSNHDLEHINSLHTFNTLLQRIGNVAYDTVASHSAGGGAYAVNEQQRSLSLGLDAAGQHITNEQISKSAVLNLADLKSSSAASNFERFFDGADMHSIINYLWIGVVTSLVILSVIFIVFSYYFYRKFREWKKCNKDIRSHMNNDIYPGGTIIHCDSLMANGQPNEAAYYQTESPPCYTIATGLPTYDEALHHQHHLSFGRKFVYPTISAVHHHPAIAESGGGCSGNATVIISNWEKDDLMLKTKEKHQLQQQQQQQQQKQKLMKVGAIATAPPTYDAAASVALLGVSEKSEAVSICMEAIEAYIEASMEDVTPTAANATRNKADDTACSSVVVA